MSLPEFQRNYFELFDLPKSFAVDQVELGRRYRKAQRETHPDRFARASAHEQRLAVQYSALINEAYVTLRQPVSRALYLLELAGISREDIDRQHPDSGFLMIQIELREKLESMQEQPEPALMLEQLLAEIGEDMIELQAEFAQQYAAGELAVGAATCVKMQYLDKLLLEAEQMEASLLEK